MVISLVIAEVWLAGGLVPTTRSLSSGVDGDGLCLNLLEAGVGELLDRIGVGQRCDVGNLALLGSGGDVDGDLVAGVDDECGTRVGVDHVIGRDLGVGLRAGCGS